MHAIEHASGDREARFAAQVGSIMAELAVNHPSLPYSRGQSYVALHVHSPKSPPGFCTQRHVTSPYLQVRPMMGSRQYAPREGCDLKQSGSPHVHAHDFSSADGMQWHAMSPYLQLT